MERAVNPLPLLVFIKGIESNRSRDTFRTSRSPESTLNPTAVSGRVASDRREHKIWSTARLLVSIYILDGLLGSKDFGRPNAHPSCGASCFQFGFGDVMRPGFGNFLVFSEN